MHDLVLFGNISSLIYLPICFILLLIASRWFYPNFSIKTHWISSLGETNQKSHYLFNIALGGLLLAGPFIAYRLINLFPKDNLILMVVAGLLLLLGISLLGVLLSPINKKLSSHMCFAYPLFASLIIINILSLLILYKNLILTITSLGALIFSITMLAGTYFMKAKYPNRIHNLKQLNKNENNILIRGITISEWLLLFFNLSWFFIVCITSVI